MRTILEEAAAGRARIVLWTVSIAAARLLP
jgi:hypothetical protein